MPTERMDPSVYLALLRGLWDGATDSGKSPDYAALYAIVNLDATLTADALAMRNSVSADVFVKRGLSQFDKDIDRHIRAYNILTVPSMVTAADGDLVNVDADIIGPLLRGEFPPIVADDEGFRTLLGPAYKKRLTPAGLILKGPPTATTTASLWNQALEGAGLDASAGDDSPSRRIKSLITGFYSEFETSAVGEEPTMREKVSAALKEAGETAMAGGKSLIVGVAEATASAVSTLATIAGISLGVYFVGPRIIRALRK